MEKEGFHIHGITCDLGNGTLMKELNFFKENEDEVQQFSFINPIDKDKPGIKRLVHVFPDSCHMIKLAR